MITGSVTLKGIAAKQLFGLNLLMTGCCDVFYFENCPRVKVAVNVICTNYVYQGN